MKKTIIGGLLVLFAWAIMGVFGHAPSLQGSPRSPQSEIEAYMQH